MKEMRGAVPSKEIWEYNINKKVLLSQTSFNKWNVMLVRTCGFSFSTSLVLLHALSLKCANTWLIVVYCCAFKISPFMRIQMCSLLCVSNVTATIKLVIKWNCKISEINGICGVYFIFTVCVLYNFVSTKIIF